MKDADYSRVMDAVRIVPTLLLPLMVYYIAGNSDFHGLVCNKLHDLEFSHMSFPALPGTSKAGPAAAADSENIAERARAAVEAANRALESSMVY